MTTAFAKVEVIKVIPISGCGKADGSITIHAEGSAGPFFITITGPNGYIYYRSDHQGELKIFNLSSPGTYNFDIQLYNSECSLTLTANLPCLLPAGTISSFGIKTTCAGASVGSIFIEDGTFSDQATFNWDGPDGFTADTKNIYGLAAGTYHLLMKDWCSSGYWCQRTETFIVKEIKLVASNSCGGTDGSSIDLELVDFDNWNVNPTYLWSTGETTQDIVGLSNGQYCVTVSLPTCSMELCQTVEGNIFEIEDPKVVSKACGTKGNGKIHFEIKTIVPISNTGGCSIYYDVEWNNQKKTVVEGDVYLDGFGEGENCFTVTGPYTDCVVRVPPTCRATKCFNMDVFSLDIVDVQNLAICKGKEPACTAKIEMASNFSQLEWEGPNQYKNLTEVVGGYAESKKLCLGDYKITGNEAGCSLSKSVNICCCNILNTHDPKDPPFDKCARPPEIIITADIDHDWQSTGDGAINLMLNVTWGTYTYKWSGPDGYQKKIKNIKNLKAGEYCVTVSDGCDNEWSKCFQVYAGCNNLALKSLFSVEQEPCSGLTDGIVKVRVPNPNKVKIDVFFDDLSVTSLVGDPAVTHLVMSLLGRIQ